MESKYSFDEEEGKQEGKHGGSDDKEHYGGDDGREEGLHIDSDEEVSPTLQG